MTAVVIPFHRRESLSSKDSATPPPPVVLDSGQALGRNDDRWCIYRFMGTREQLIAWGVVTVEQFPVGRKRFARNGPGEPSVKRVTSRPGLYLVFQHCSYSIPGEETYAARLDTCVRRILSAHGVQQRNLLRVMNAIDRLRREMFNTVAYDQGLLMPLDEATASLQTVMSAVAAADQLRG